MHWFLVNYIMCYTHHLLSLPYTKIINNLSSFILKNTIFACFCNVLQCMHIWKPSRNDNIFHMKYCYFITSGNFFNVPEPKKQKLSTFNLHAVWLAHVKCKHFRKGDSMTMHSKNTSLVVSVADYWQLFSLSGQQTWHWLQWHRHSGSQWWLFSASA